MHSYELPPSLFHEQHWHDREQAQLFSRCWTFAGVTTDVAKPGDFKTVEVAGDTLIVVRDRHEVLRAFHNICRHRGAPLVQGEGNCSTFTCPYHRWSFSLDGALRGLPQRDQFPAFDLQEHGLFKASVEQWNGMLFVHTDAQPEQTLTSWLDSFADELQPFHLYELEEIATDSFTIDANWKLYVENHIDWLHLWYLHEHTLGSYNHPEGQLKQHGAHWTSFEYPREGTAAERFGGTDGVLNALPYESNDDQRFGAIGAHLLFPNVPVFTGPGFFMTAVLTPESATRTRMSLRLFGTPGGDTKRFLKQFYDITKEEDVRMIESIQRNISSSKFEVGPIAHTWEAPIAKFHESYRSFVDLNP